MLIKLMILKRLSALKTFGKEELSIDKYIYEWYNQDYDSTDMIPLIGRVKYLIVI